MVRILLAGVVSPRGLGDALQYLVGAFLAFKQIPEAELEVFAPATTSDFVSECSNIGKRVKILPGLQEVSAITSIIRKTARMNSSILKREFFEKFEVDTYADFPRYLGKVLLPLKTIAKFLYGVYYENGVSIFYVRPALCRLFMGSNYDGGFIGGHTIEASAFFDYLTVYNCARSIVKGPLVTYPISASSLGLRRREKHLEKLRRSLSRLDAIFVRGKHSYDILSTLIDPDKLLMALDSGFGIRLLYENPGAVYKTSELTVCIVPRKDYFYVYDLGEEIYAKYLSSLKQLIEVLNHLGAEILLVPHTLKSPIDTQNITDEDAVSDLLKFFDERTKKSIKVVKPRIVLASARAFCSCDIVITSRVHAGIIALAYGKPVVFFMPRDDVKMLDVLSYLGLNEKRYVVDSFNPKEYERLIPTVMDLLQNLTKESRIIEYAVGKRLLEVEKPAKLMKKLISQ